MPKTAKAEAYLCSLEDARCTDDWDAVPELVRKVRKHASDRECVATTAETEYAITKAKLEPDSSRPTTARSTINTELLNLLPKLQSALANETNHGDERFQAELCVGWLHWAVGEYDLAVATLPQNLDRALSRNSQHDSSSEWTKVCALKAAYLRANCLARNDQPLKALDVFESALVSLSAILAGQQRRKQLQFWAELFLSEFCMLQGQSLESGERTLRDSNSLAAFRSWAKYWDASRTPGGPPKGGRGFRGAVPRRRIWNEYYTAISAILDQGLPFPTAYAEPVDSGVSAKAHLRMELKRVEAAYETLLLDETSFPRADEERGEVETFVSVVMSNWSIMSGRKWHDDDLGPHGKEGLSRGVLDILYRASTKTYHSPAILRHLFTVHLSVAEFDMAFKALDSYLEIVERGKARVDKTGHPEPHLDDDATVLETMAKAITALCKYGSREAVEKARDLGTVLEAKLQQLPPPLPTTDESISTLEEENVNGEVIHPRLAASVNALAWQAIGLSQAYWSRTTYDALSRTDFQAKAIRCLQKSLSPDTGNPTDVRALFALALMLAEQRELAAAIDLVKAALGSNKKSTLPQSLAGSYWRERSSIPLWHLLALLLSARQDYLVAARACEAAFEQFGDPAVLFGTQTPVAFRSDHLNEVGANNHELSSSGLVDEMDDTEKEGILEVKMTQLVLLELLEGPEVAVNASNELLGLYARLFGPPKPNQASSALRPSTSAPKSASGTLRSLKGGIFRHKSDKVLAGQRPISTMQSGQDLGLAERPVTAATITSMATTRAPTIQVTRDNGDGAGAKRSNSARSRQRSVSARGRQSEASRTRSLKKRDSGSHQSRSVSTSRVPGPVRTSVPGPATISDGDAYFTPVGESVAKERADFFPWHNKTNLTSQLSSKDRGSFRFSSTISSNRNSVADPDKAILDSLSYPNALPTIHFPTEQANRQRQAILVKVWLMIAAFYRRARLFRDSEGAIREARKLADDLRLDVAGVTDGSVTSCSPGWGSRKSVEELWSDVRSEMGYLSVAEGKPYVARDLFEEALIHDPNHPSATVGLSNILLDIYSEALLPEAAVPSLTTPGSDMATSPYGYQGDATSKPYESVTALVGTPLGLGGQGTDPSLFQTTDANLSQRSKPSQLLAAEELVPSHKALSLPLIDRLAARDRAYGLLTSLTKLGIGWNLSEAWFALARAHEESGQAAKAKEVLWWCVELEEGMGIREWTCVGIGGYVL